jgi:hypothetical protein
MVQYPARFLVPVSLLAAALIAVMLPSCGVTLRRLALVAGFALGAAGIVFAFSFGDHMSTGAVRTSQALHPPPIVPEYIPAEAGASGWLGAEHATQIEMWARAPGLVARAAGLVSPCVQRLPRSVRRGEAQLTFNVEGCTGATVLPQFYFPGWVVEAGARILSAIPDPASGLLEIVVPPGSKTVTLRRTWLAIEFLGLLVSGVSFFLWLECFAWVVGLVFSGPFGRDLPLGTQVP